MCVHVCVSVCVCERETFTSYHSECVLLLHQFLLTVLPVVCVTADLPGCCDGACGDDGLQSGSPCLHERVHLRGRNTQEQI